MGCCAIEPGHNRNKEKVFVSKFNRILSITNNLRTKLSNLNIKNKQWKKQLVKYRSSKNNKNHLVALKENQYAVYNKDDLNAVEDQFLRQAFTKPQEVDKANSDDDY